MASGQKTSSKSSFMVHVVLITKVTPKDNIHSNIEPSNDSLIRCGMCAAFDFISFVTNKN